MPSVDISSPNQGGTGGGKEGFGTGIPTPILLAMVGGGIGLVVFLSRKAGTPSDGQSQGGYSIGKGQQALLPNTAIMLGSLQQGVLDLQGQVSMGNADLSSQMTGLGESLSSQIDIQSANTQQAFSDLNTYLGSNFTAIQGSESALSQAIAGLGTQNAGLADSLTQVLQQLYGVNTGLTNAQNASAWYYSQLAGGLGGLSQQMQTAQAGINAIGAGVNGTYNQLVAGQNADLAYYNALGQRITSLSGQIAALPIGSTSQPSSGGGGGGGTVHQYVVNLPGGGQKTVNASSPSAAIGNAGGGTIASQVH